MWQKLLLGIRQTIDQNTLRTKETLEYSHLERSVLAQNVFEKDHTIFRSVAKILRLEKRFVCRQYKRVAHVLHLKITTVNLALKFPCYQSRIVYVICFYIPL
jgi:hypothetical protein